ncbi:glycosyltransferase family 2 protein [Patescibacteria group bacterium]|nr:glycosyltransferase family 2 protein [Patescibacteria group bacterium]MBU2579458.1 glycosyltransferase family 2 protein [Patescibacteria group bacterium]MBU4031150.1 glycosyltransferase family 2 protein [Patescibacteria group bacterium]MCG2701304.1 glycosyltransferase family 2 protein [Candidatus Parcubacteria bacterium]MCG2809043.1 glycosyltransferase family 2 protein [Candidatus Portnoybacteria bacterium]
MNPFVIIPACNEEKTISQVIEGVREYTENIIVIDDGSNDSTYELARKSTQNIQNAVVLRHNVNLGKGAALKTGCQAAIQLGSEVIVLIDADGQHSPADIPNLVKKLQEEKLDIVFGSRKINREIPFVRFLGNRFLTKSINFLSCVSITDTQSGFKAFRSEIYPKIAWTSSDYRAETEMIINVGKNNLKYGQTPIQTIYKNAHKGATIIDGIKIFFNLLKWKL